MLEQPSEVAEPTFKWTIRKAMNRFALRVRNLYFGAPAAEPLLGPIFQLTWDARFRARRDEVTVDSILSSIERGVCHHPRR